MLVVLHKKIIVWHRAGIFFDDNIIALHDVDIGYIDSGIWYVVYIIFEAQQTIDMVFSYNINYI